jgi:hypothetical protein
MMSAFGLTEVRSLALRAAAGLPVLSPTSGLKLARQRALSRRTRRTRVARADALRANTPDARHTLLPTATSLTRTKC